MQRRKPKHHQTPPKIRPLVVGGGAREHALAWRLKKSPSVDTLYTTHPNNPGLAAICKPPDAPFNISELYRLEQLISRERINLVVVGPEQPLADGIADKLAHLENHPEPTLVFGPTAAAAQIESSKAWAKKIMRAAAVPTAESRTFKDAHGAIEYIRSRETPQVVKASGLAAGKGVFIPESADDAVQAVQNLTSNPAFKDAASEIIIEERLEGPEVSVFAITDGKTIAVLDACQDHKRLLDNDEGPNTGGMGAYCPVPDTILPNHTLNDIARAVLVPTIDALKREDLTYKGVLYAGIMLTPAGPKVLEFNARFGDPEAQCLVHRIKGDFAKLLFSAAAGNLDDAEFDTHDHAAVTIVLAAEGYPDAPVKGAEITGIEQAEAQEGITVFHAGTERKHGKVLTAGGRVLSVTATAPTVTLARDNALAAAELINFKGKQNRTDIAHQATNPATANPA